MKFAFEIKIDTSLRKKNLYQGKVKLSDISSIFNLIQNGSKYGFFNSVYLQPRYQVGLAIQLFSVFLFGTIRLPSGIRYKATLYVIRQKKTFAGFALTRYLVPSGESQEIYMCAVEESYRGNGFGKCLIQSLISNLKCNETIEAECLPDAIHMKKLLRSMGFKSINPTVSTVRNYVTKFKYTHKPKT